MLFFFSLNPGILQKSDMSQVSSLRLFFPANSFHSLTAPILVPDCVYFSRCFPVFLPSYLKRRISTVSSSYSNKRNSRFINRKRGIMTDGGTEKDTVHDLETEDGNRRTSEAAEKQSGFNRKRAEGREDSSGPRKNLALKVRKLNPVNTIAYLQILGTGMDTQDTSPSVLLFFDKQRFIFNAGEGLQRFCNEHKIKLSKIDHIFLSRVCSETAGGLPGLLLTLAGMGEEGVAVNLWGPLDLKYFVEAMRSFIPNAATVHTHSFGLAPSNSGSPSRTPRNHDVPLVLVDDEVVKISALLLETSVDVAKPGGVSVVYICELPEIKGKFDPEKAKSLGLRPGPKYRELQLGNAVKSDRDGAMVHPRDVLGPSSPGPIVLLVDCPTESHFRDLVSRESLNPYYIDTAYQVPEGSKIVNCVVHMTPACVAQTDEYRNWMSKFAAARHIMAGHEMKNIEIPILKASARIGARLNYICPQLFPSSGIWSLKSLNIMPNQVKPMKQNVLRKGAESPAENLLKFHLRPSASLGIDASCVPSKSSTSDIIDELLSEIPEIKDASLRAAKFWSKNKQFTLGETTALDAERSANEEPWLHDVEKPSCLENISREDMEIVLLGTGSSQPSKHRNVSSILINLFSKGSVILDCGEGTLGQLKRRFGIKGADDIVRGLRCIWISHIHADHHTGLARILALRKSLLNGMPHEPLVVIGPRQLKRYLDAYQRLEDLDMQFLDCGLTTETALVNFASYREDSAAPSGDAQCVGSGNLDTTLFAKGSRMQSISMRPHNLVMPIFSSLKKSLKEAGLEALISFPVVHCPQSFGVILQATDRVNEDGKKIPGWKVVYSGDTRPCPETVKASRGATVLIHEATFEDGLMEEAIARNHSTTQEAVEVGDSAGAYRIILTHFSQRYPKIPVFDEAHMDKTCIAFDLMSVNLADIHLLPRLLPYLKLLFKNETEDVNSETAALV